MKIMIKSKIVQKVEDLNTFLSENDWFDFSFSTFKEKEIKIIGSKDFSYYHQVEVSFLGVQFYSGTFEWGTSPKWRKPLELVSDDAAQIIIDENDISEPCLIFMFNSDSENKILIAAKNIDIIYKDVIYY